MTRVCATCPTRISRYNHDDTCSACQAREAEAARVAAIREEEAQVERERAAEALRLARIRELEAEQRAAKVAARAPRPGSDTRRAWDALPATAKEVAERSGLDPDTASKTLRNMLAYGWVTSEGQRGNRATGPTTIYRRATRDEEAA